MLCRYDLSAMVIVIQNAMVIVIRIPMPSLILILSL